MNSFKPISKAFCIFSILVFSGAAIAADPVAELLDANGVANLVIAASDGSLTPAELCGLSFDESMQISGAVHSALDGAVAKYVASRSASGSYSQPGWETCLEQCTCSVYTSVLESVGFEKLNLDDKKAYRRISSLAREQTREDTARCVRSDVHVCKSAVLSSAREDSK